LRSVADQNGRTAGGAVGHVRYDERALGQAVGDALRHTIPSSGASDFKRRTLCLHLRVVEEGRAQIQDLGAVGDKVEPTVATGGLELAARVPGTAGIQHV